MVACESTSDYWVQIYDLLCDYLDVIVVGVTQMGPSLKPMETILIQLNWINVFIDLQNPATA